MMSFASNFLNLVKSKLRPVLMRLASNPRTPPAVLSVLSSLQETALIERIAEHPLTPPEALVQLAWHAVPEVRIALVSNPNCPVWIVCKLCRDDCVDVRYSIAENPHVPLEVLLLLSRDENPYVAGRARTTLNRVEFERPVRMIKRLFPLNIQDRRLG